MMEKHNPSILTRFEPFFNPRSLVIVGASRNEYTFNGVVLKNLLEAQYKGKIYIVHPYTDSLMGISCIKAVDELQIIFEKPELAIILTQKDLLETIQSLGELKIQNILIETDITFNHSTNQSEELIKKIKELITKYDLHILGPSMIGIIDFQHSFTTSVIPTRSHILQPNKKNKPTQGISFLAQSGGLTGACGWWKAPQEIPFAKVLHIGSAIDIKEEELLEYLFQDPATSIIILYLKHISQELINTIQKYEHVKPVLFKYVGREQEPVQEFIKFGAFEVRNYIELFEFAKVLLWCPPPSSNAVGIIGPSSGAINLLISEMRIQGIHLAQLNDDNRDFILKKVGGSTCALGNPVDYWPPVEFIGTQVCRVYHNASNTLLNDPHVGALFLALEFFTEIEFNFTIFERIKEKYPNKPIICVLIQAEKEGAERIIKIATELKIPVFIDEVERAVRSLKCALMINKTI